MADQWRVPAACGAIGSAKPTMPAHGPPAPSRRPRRRPNPQRLNL